MQKERSSKKWNKQEIALMGAIYGAFQDRESNTFKKENCTKNNIAIIKKQLKK